MFAATSPMKKRVKQSIYSYTAIALPFHSTCGVYHIIINKKKYNKYKQAKTLYIGSRHRDTHQVVAAPSSEIIHVADS